MKLFSKFKFMGWGLKALGLAKGGLGFVMRGFNKMNVHLRYLFIFFLILGSSIVLSLITTFNLMLISGLLKAIFWTAVVFGITFAFSTLKGIWEKKQLHQNSQRLYEQFPVSAKQLFNEVDRLLNNENVDKASKVLLENMKERICTLTGELYERVEMKNQISGIISDHENFQEEESKLFRECEGEESFDISLSTKTLLEQSNKEYADICKLRDVLSEGANERKVKLKELLGLLDQLVERSDLSARDTKATLELRDIQHNTKSIVGETKKLYEVEKDTIKSILNIKTTSKRKIAQNIGVDKVKRA